MAIVIKTQFIEEEIQNEKGEKIGVLKFNPNDSKIMKKLTEVVDIFTNAVNKMDNLEKKINEIDTNSESTEDFEKNVKRFEIIKEGFDVEYDSIDKSISNLKEVFGEETVNLFTGNTTDFESLYPIIAFVIPHVNKARNNKVSQYLVSKDDVME